MKLIYIITLLFSLSVTAQVSKSITIEGAIAKPILINFSDFKAYKSISLDSLQIFNHKLEYKSTLKDMKGVLLKDILAKAEFNVNSPKELSEFYIMCIADDGYKVVFSWNEIFNNPTGDQTLVVTDMKGVPTINKKEGIILLTPTDKATGRRYIKNFSKVRIQQVK